jgi:uncharacterized protein Yka (UPF0111/DUF47 family)
MIFGHTRYDRIQELLEKHIQNTVEAAEQLETLLVNLHRGPDYVGNVVQKLVEMEHAGDDYKEKIHLVMDKTFITRLHKDDINKLTHELDRVIDHIKKVALYLRAYHLTTGRQEAVDFTRIVVEMTKLLVLIITGLARPNVLTMREIVSRVEKFEEEADFLLYTSLANLFASESDGKTVLEWQSLLEKLEEVTDSCHHVATIAVSIARKES